MSPSPGITLCQEAGLHMIFSLPRVGSLDPRLNCVSIQRPDFLPPLRTCPKDILAPKHSVQLAKATVHILFLPNPALPVLSRLV